MLSRIRRLSQDKFARSGMIFLVANMLAQAFNYLYHLAMGRMLGPADYAVVGTAFTFFYIASYASNALTIVISRFTAEIPGIASWIVDRAMRKVMLISLVFFVVFSAASPLIASLLHIEIWVVVMSALVCIGIVLNNVQVGALNGLQRFVWQNVVVSANSVLKFGLAVALVLAGAAVAGALGAVLAAFALSVLLATVPLYEQLPTSKVPAAQVYAYLPLALAGSVLPVLLITTDLLLVKHFFPAAAAGLYAAATTIGKIIWFGAGFLGMAIFPQVVAAKAARQPTSHILRKAMFATATMSAIAVLVYALVPGLIVWSLYGSAYSEIRPLLLPLAAAMACYTAAMLIVQYELALQRRAFVPVVIASFVLQTAAVLVWHSSLQQVAYAVLAANLLFLAGLCWAERKHLLPARIQASSAS